MRELSIELEKERQFHRNVDERQDVPEDATEDQQPYLESQEQTQTPSGAEGHQ